MPLSAKHCRMERYDTFSACLSNMTYTIFHRLSLDGYLDFCYPQTEWQIKSARVIAIDAYDLGTAKSFAHLAGIVPADGECL